MSAQWHNRCFTSVNQHDPSDKSKFSLNARTYRTLGCTPAWTDRLAQTRHRQASNGSIVCPKEPDLISDLDVRQLAIARRRRQSMGHVRTSDCRLSCRRCLQRGRLAATQCCEWCQTSPTSLRPPRSPAGRESATGARCGDQAEAGGRAGRPKLALSKKASTP